MGGSLDAFVIEKGGSDGAGTNAGDNIIAEDNNGNGKILGQRQDIRITSPAYAPLTRKGGTHSLVVEKGGIDGNGTNAGDKILLDGSNSSNANEGGKILLQREDDVFLHSGMRTNTIYIKGSSGEILNSVSGFAPGPIDLSVSLGAV
jgi:hypothetical protein